MHTIRDIVKQREPFYVDASDTVAQVVRHLCDRKTGAVAVKDGEELAGVFSERDLMHRVVREGLDPERVLVREVMSTNLCSIRLEDDIRMAKAVMHQNGVRHLLVIDNNNQYRGMVSMRELVEADIADRTELVQKLNDTYYQAAYKARFRISSNRVIIEPYVP